jgi:hypothetical protein
MHPWFRAELHAERFFQPDRRREGERPPARQRLFERRQADLRHVGKRLARDAAARDLFAHAAADLARLPLQQIAVLHSLPFSMRDYPHISAQAVNDLSAAIGPG